MTDDAVTSPTSSVKNPILVRERRRALIDAAVEVFFAKGYHACRVADVAEAAGISQGTVYNYVNSKEDLLFMIVEDHFLAYERIVGSALEPARTSREKLDALLKGTVEAIFKYRKHYVVMLRELHHVERNRRRAFMQLAAEQRKFCENILVEIAEEENLKIGNSLLMSNLVVFLPSFLISRGWDFRKEVNEQEVAEFLIDFMERGLRQN
ncbi:MAG: TetR/AcrR family transcriptional regulator [Pseudolabrys sp.]|nr:TetR/AcrR family transcriptional regulator [Pseudolabrys sp.]